MQFFLSVLFLISSSGIPSIVYGMSGLEEEEAQKPPALLWLQAADGEPISISPEALALSDFLAAAQKTPIGSALGNDFSQARPYKLEVQKSVLEPLVKIMEAMAKAVDWGNKKDWDIVLNEIGTLKTTAQESIIQEADVLQIDRIINLFKQLDYHENHITPLLLQSSPDGIESLAQRIIDKKTDAPFLPQHKELTGMIKRYLLRDLVWRPISMWLGGFLMGGGGMPGPSKYDLLDRYSINELLLLKVLDNIKGKKDDIKKEVEARPGLKNLLFKAFLTYDKTLPFSGEGASYFGLGSIPEELSNPPAPSSDAKYALEQLHMQLLALSAQ